MSKGPEMILPWRKPTNDQEVNENVLNTTSHQGEVIPNHNISSNLLNQLLSKRQELTSSGMDVEQTEPFRIICENINWSGLYGKWHGVSSKN